MLERTAARRGCGYRQGSGGKFQAILIYRRLNEVLDQAGFDEFCEARCRQFYHEKLGRPSLAPGMYSGRC